MSQPVALAPAAPHDPIRPRWRADPDDMEQISRLIATLTIHPIKSLACYFFPVFGSFTSNYSTVYRNDIAQQAKIDEVEKDLLFKEVDALKACSGLRRGLTVCTGLMSGFHCYGGQISITDPLIAIPHHRFIRPGKAPTFGAERPEIDKLDDDPWLLSDNETRFFIARELGHIKNNDTLLRIAAKVGILAATFFMYFGVVGILTGVAIAIVSIGLFILSEILFQKKMDIVGVEIFGKRLRMGEEETPQKVLESEIKATDIAIHALEKLRLQNVARRVGSYFTRIHVTPSGNNLFDITNLFYTKRVTLLQAHRAKLAASLAALSL
ncbi:MAG: hypothetical protein JSS32_04130 [Verrucomicrobia bacterium]|nr:hypothetical protein [Verrucomicrobiota bacterium]